MTTENARQAKIETDMDKWVKEVLPTIQFPENEDILSIRMTIAVPEWFLRSGGSRLVRSKDLSVNTDSRLISTAPDWSAYTRHAPGCEINTLSLFWEGVDFTNTLQFSSSLPS